MNPMKTKDVITDRNFQATSQEIDALKLRIEQLEAKAKILLKSINRMGGKL